MTDPDDDEDFLELFRGDPMPRRGQSWEYFRLILSAVLFFGLCLLLVLSIVEDWI